MPTEQTSSDLAGWLFGGAEEQSERQTWADWLYGSKEEEIAAQNLQRRDSKKCGAAHQYARVFVRVYDLATDFGEGNGELSESYGGMLHTGVEVHGLEWCFPMLHHGEETRISSCQPGQNPHHKFRQTLSMGYTCCDRDEVLAIINEMREDFKNATFDAKSRNWNHFTEAFCYRLGVARLPAWVNSLASPTAAPAVERVYVRVYDLGQTFVTRGYNSVLKSFGAFHSAVEVYGREYSFGQTLSTVSTGVAMHVPGHNKGHSFRETLSMGYTRCSEQQVEQILQEMKREWKGCTYNVFERNCHSFSDALCMKLGVGHLPAWVNDLASTFAADPASVDLAHDSRGKAA